MKKPEDMTDNELRAACGIPEGCPDAVFRALVEAKVDRWTREAIAAVQAAARKQITWTAEQKEEARLESLRRQCVRNLAA